MSLTSAVPVLPARGNFANGKPAKTGAAVPPSVETTQAGWPCRAMSESMRRAPLAGTGVPVPCGGKQVGGNVSGQICACEPRRP